MKHLTIWLMSLSFVLIGCTPSFNEYSPDQVIQNALKEKNNIPAYYAESQWITTERGEIIETITMKEWSSPDGRKRVEVSGNDESDNGITVNDGAQIMTYIPKDNKAYLFGQELASLNQQSPKEQAEQMLKMIQDTHDIEVLGEDVIAGRKAFHLKATVKKEKSFIGNEEIWIDKETWLILKTKSKSSEVSVEWKYTKIEFNPRLSEELFTIDLPDDVEIKSFDNMVDMREVTLEEAKAQLGKSFLYFPETNELKIDYIELVDLGNDMKHEEITIEYENNGLPILSLSIFETPPDTDEQQLESLFSEKALTVRGLDMKWSEELRLIRWVEDGLSYSAIVLDPNLSLAQLTKLLEDMIYYN